jgi:hypothetical protein
MGEKVPKNGKRLRTANESNEEKFKSDLKSRKKQYEEDTLKVNEKHKKELDAANKKYLDLKKTHDREVHDLFQNVGTLKFVKEMRFFKKQWDE